MERPHHLESRNQNRDKNAIKLEPMDHYTLSQDPYESRRATVKTNSANVLDEGAIENEDELLDSTITQGQRVNREDKNISEKDAAHLMGAGSRT